MKQRLCKTYTLAHTLGQIGNISISTVFHLNHFKRIVNHFVAVGQVAEVGHKFQIIKHCHVGIKRNCLWQVPHSSANFYSFFKHIETSNLSRSVGRGHVSGQDAHRSGFSGAIWAKESHHLALVGFEGQFSIALLAP